MNNKYTWSLGFIDTLYLFRVQEDRMHSIVGAVYQKYDKRTDRYSFLPMIKINGRYENLTPVETVEEAITIVEQQIALLKDSGNGPLSTYNGRVFTIESGPPPKKRWWEFWK